MGVINATPDSFSDGGLRLDPARAIADALRMVEDGADFIDVGGESTRPGADEVSIDEEIGRILPIVGGLARQAVPVSIDTRRAAVMAAAIDAGARIVNDTSALRDDRDSLRLVAERRCGVILMHRRGTAADRYRGPAYAEVVADVRDFLAGRVADCLEAGVAPRNIAIDPGIGFGKLPPGRYDPDQNLRLIAGIPALLALGHPVMIGASRKQFVGHISGEPDPARRLGGSLALALEAARRGAAILRVHDVRETVQALKAVAALAAADDA
ncbi:MAG: dihydropteroate synthase [Alphaproteobacteria bacterium]|nr:dihydropteroate synthase [Alphaproteobacteria bacterium]MCW5743209.1 dihydropteroate synthase [Alphaproteobacteria bacterium]